MTSRPLDPPPPATPDATHDTTPDAPPATPSRTLRRVGQASLVLLVLFAGGGVHRALSKTAQLDALAARTLRDAPRSVITTQAALADNKRSLALPGTLRGSVEAAIYARSNGYVSAALKNIGDRVTKGDLLATIEAPEQDQELAQARAAREQIRARLALAQSSLARWEGLRARDAVSQQELEERRSAVQQAQADVAAADANIARLAQLQAFRRITAPFSGTVIRRNVDVGTLISAGSSGGSRELFALAQTDPLRLNVAVPQAYVAAVRLGQEVDVTLPEAPATAIKGTIRRTAGAIDSATRSMQIEIHVPNPDGRLLPGAYTQVSLGLHSTEQAFVLPPNTLVFGQEGPRVAVVGADQRIVLKPVRLGRDFGKAVEILAGITGEERVVINPPDALQAGEQVRVVPPPTAGAGKKS